MSREFQLKVIGADKWDIHDDNIDVEVILSDRSRYTATFFTVRNLTTLFEKNRKSGECCDGLYFWACEMIIVERLEKEVLEKTISQLIEDGEFETAFTRVPDVGNYNIHRSGIVDGTK